MPYKSAVMRNVATRKYYAVLREKVLDMYGRECLRCGYADDTRALHIDHVCGGGSKDLARHSSHHFKRRILREVNSGLYQTLCANCNTIKAQETR